MHASILSRTLAVVFALSMPLASPAQTIEPAISGVRIEALQAKLAAGSPVDLQIDDSWPNACVPRFDRVEVRGRDIDVFAREPAAARTCLPRESRYRIDTRFGEKGRALTAEDGVQRVRYFVESDSGVLLRGFELIGPAGREAPGLPESGLWWPDPAEPAQSAGPGIGLALERQGDQLGLQIFGYGDDGNPEWTIASGRVDGALPRLPLTRFSGGAGPRLGYRAPQQGELIGRVLLEPVSAARAILWVAYDEVGGSLALRKVPIIRFALAGSAASYWSGAWLLALPGSGDGFGRSLELEFGPAVPLDSGFLLLDTRNGVELECEFAAGVSSELPDLCRLRMPAEDVDALIESPALQSLQGSDAKGRTLRLFRLQP